MTRTDRYIISALERIADQLTELNDNMVLLIRGIYNLEEHPDGMEEESQEKEGQR
jgi:hypothetical protein